MVIIPVVWFLAALTVAMGIGVGIGLAVTCCCVANRDGGIVEVRR